MGTDDTATSVAGLNKVSLKVKNNCLPNKVKKN